jgi:hypothetical protein
MNKKKIYLYIIKEKKGNKKMKSGEIIGPSILSIIISIISIMLANVNFDDEIKIKENKRKDDRELNNIEKIIYYFLKPLKKNNNNNNTSKLNRSSIDYDNVNIDDDDDDDNEIMIFNIDDNDTSASNSIRRKILFNLRKEIMIMYNKAKNGLYASILFALVLILLFKNRFDYLAMALTCVPIICLSITFLARDIIRFRFLLEEDFFDILDAISLSSSSSSPPPLQITTSTPPPPLPQKPSLLKRLFRPNFAYSRLTNSGNDVSEKKIDASKTFWNILLLFAGVFFAVEFVYYLLLQRFGVGSYEKYGRTINLILFQVILVQMTFSTVIHAIDRRLNAGAIVRTFIENLTFVLISSLPFLVSGVKLDLFIVFNCITLPALIHVIRLLYLIPYYKPTVSNTDTPLDNLIKFNTDQQTQRRELFLDQEKQRHIILTDNDQTQQQELSEINIAPFSYTSFEITERLFDDFLSIHRTDYENMIYLPDSVNNVIISRMNDLKIDFNGTKQLFILINGKYYISPKNIDQYDPLNPVIEYLQSKKFKF